MAETALWGETNNTPVWANAAKSNLKSLQAVQNRFLMTIFYLE